MPRLHVFNPDTDYALASDRRYYTPPSKIQRLRRELCLLPTLYANLDDLILIDDIPKNDLGSLPYMEDVCKKGHRLITVSELKDKSELLETYEVNPWGWNRSIRQFFVDINKNSIGLPSQERIEKLRQLSHRRTTIEFLRLIPEEFRHGISLPVEIFNTVTAMRAYMADHRRYFKAPWSSSGRGILLTDDLEEIHVEPWVRGIIRRQGSVLMEKAYDRKLDFATEWMCEDGKGIFLGVSVFNVSRRGKYHGNISLSQKELYDMIEDVIKPPLHELITAQKEVIDHLIAPFYDGPMGIDMLATKSGDVNPCVELNLRHTMGMVGLLGPYRRKR